MSATWLGRFGKTQNSETSMLLKIAVTFNRFQSSSSFKTFEVISNSEADTYRLSFHIGRRTQPNVDDMHRSFRRVIVAEAKCADDLSNVPKFDFYAFYIR